MNNVYNTATQETKTNENNEALSNLIQSIQSKLNEKEINNETNNTNNIDNSPIQNTNDNTQNSNFEFSNILNILGNINNNNENSDFNFGNLDPKLFNKIQQIIINIGKKDPKKDLLISLKPFLRKSRQDKLNEYITILTIIKAFEAFRDKGSDKNV